MSTLSPRQQSILNRVVDIHIETAQPVGSKCLTELYAGLYRSSYSPATVRHEMGVLENLGYLTHPHTSAGRVPTDRGYRYYVEYGLPQDELPEEMARDMREGLEPETGGGQGYGEKAASLLSKFAHEIAVVLMTSPGYSGPQCRWLTYLNGASLVFDKPEFLDLKKVQQLFSAFEQKEEFAEWLVSKCKEEGVEVSIGSENQHPALKECSVVSAACRNLESRSAVVALIGPRRMRYSRAVTLVRHTARLLEHLFAGKD